MAPFTLAHDLVLLSYDDAGTDRLGRPALDHGLAGALLVELALAGRIAVEDDRLAVVDPTPVGQAQLDAALARIAAEPKRRRPRDWITRLAGDLPEQVLDGLVTAGVLRRESDRVLWVFPRTRYPSSTGAEPAVESEVRRRMTDAVTGDGPVDPRTVALVGLVRAVGLDREVFRGLPKDVVKRRTEELAAGGWAVAATRKAIEDTQVALLAATTATTAVIITTIS
ncbi:GOLPH3/VPS74 family protein [Micromonospora endolithica]|uniref:GPP34 family phosphoprotein n=1 Tax=Micromonospora endolithica TaxID=230091 RepID=A0A3A9ZDK0_9ACTN|nr:GPP34 family phosphoprotein [Micromonospora endolithica]RKN46502.1 GPP34 family phosphoprotein [Micromonospora endolithica]TWJ24841.1 Golgi phosphoprotein 3 GPP34 [Micromonospora endolithica]